MHASNGESGDTAIVVAGARAAIDGWIAAVEWAASRGSWRREPRAKRQPIPVTSSKSRAPPRGRNARRHHHALSA